MRGSLAKGDSLFVSATDFEFLKKGDVVAFDCGGKVIAHRIVGREADGFITQGDANAMRDRGRLTPGQLIGRVVARERSGRRSPVRGGMQGRFRGAFVRLANRIFRLGVKALDMPYRVFGASRLATFFWRPRITTVRFAEGAKSFIKFIHRGKTVACWYPQERRWTCRKPYDLILSPPSFVDR